MTNVAVAIERVQLMHLQHGDSQNQLLHIVQSMHFSRLEYAAIPQTSSPRPTDLQMLQHIKFQYGEKYKSGMHSFCIKTLQ